ncbi:hypothetical protein D3C75_556050 [compost metagenome]
MDQAVFQQEIQRAVHRRRRGATTVLLAEDRENVVGTQRLVALPHQLQHSPAQRGQAQTLTCAQGIGLGQSAVNAM